MGSCKFGGVACGASGIVSTKHFNVYHDGWKQWDEEEEDGGYTPASLC